MVCLVDHPELQPHVYISAVEPNQVRSLLDDGADFRVQLLEVRWHRRGRTEKTPPPAENPAKEENQGNGSNSDRAASHSTTIGDHGVGSSRRPCGEPARYRVTPSLSGGKKKAGRLSSRPAHLAFTPRELLLSCGRSASASASNCEAADTEQGQSTRHRNGRSMSDDVRSENVAIRILELR